MKLRLIFRPFLLAFLAAALFTACTSENTPVPEAAAKLEPIVTTAIVEIEDSVATVVPPTPAAKPSKRKTVEYDPMVVNVFSNLAKETNGELYYSKSAEAVSNTILKLLQKHAEEQADVVFLIDNTGSMWDDIIQIQASLNDILDVLQALPNVRVGVAGYGDKNVDEDDWYRAQPLSANFDNVRSFIANMPINGGGDWPESVYDAMMRVLDEFHWDNGKRMILLLGDAPPLEGGMSQYHLQDVLQKTKEAHIDANVYPVVIGQSMELDWPDSLAM